MGWAKKAFNGGRMQMWNFCFYSADFFCPSGKDFWIALYVPTVSLVFPGFRRQRHVKYVDHFNQKECKTTCTCVNFCSWWLKWTPIAIIKCNLRNSSQRLLSGRPRMRVSADARRRESTRLVAYVVLCVCGFSSISPFILSPCAVGGASTWHDKLKKKHTFNESFLERLSWPVPCTTSTITRNES